MKLTKQLWSTAYHESGHTVMAWLEQIKINAVTIVPNDDTLGSMEHRNPLQDIRLDIDNSARARLRVERLARVYLAGPIAQRRYSPKGWRHSHGESDFHSAVEMLEYVTGSDRELEAYLALLQIQAEQKLDLWWHLVKRLAGELTRESTMNAKAIRDFLSLNEMPRVRP